LIRNRRIAVRRPGDMAKKPYVPIDTTNKNQSLRASEEQFTNDSVEYLDFKEYEQLQKSDWKKSRKTRPIHKSTEDTNGAVVLHVDGLLGRISKK